MNEDKFREIVRDIILEQSDDKKKKNDDGKKKGKEPSKKTSTKPGEIGVSVGRGGWSKQVKEAGALAESDPQSLMDRLGIEKTGGDLKGILTILQQALENDVMDQAYAGVDLVSKGKKQGVKLSPSGIDQRNGIKYLQHTLVGAKNSGKLSLGVPIQVAPLDDGAIIVYVGDKKGTW